MLFFGANVIANYWLQIPGAEMTLVALSPAIFFVAISSVMRGYFNGRQNIKATARSQTIEQVFKTALTIILVNNSCYFKCINGVDGRWSNISYYTCYNVRVWIFVFILQNKKQRNSCRDKIYS